MKPNIFLILMAVILSLLMGYLIYHIAQGKENDALCGITSLICLVSTSIPLLGLQFDSVRLGVNLKVISAITFILFLIENILFAASAISMPYYIILNGLILVVFLTIFYKLSKIRNI